MARDSQLLLTGASPRAARIRHWVTRTFAGRFLALGALLKLVAALVGLGLRESSIVGAVDTIGDINLVVGATVLLYRLFADARRRLLWRVRRKLTISYLLIGFVPALLIITFFVLGFLIVLFNVGTYMLKTRLDAIVEQAHFIADSAAIELQQARDPDSAADVLERRRTVAAGRHRQAALAIVDGACGKPSPGAPARVTAGPWSHQAAPGQVPGWVPCAGYAGLVTYDEGQDTGMAARAVSWLPGARPRAVIVDLPIDAMLIEELRQETGIRVMSVATPRDTDAERGEPAPASSAGNAGLSPTERFPWTAFVECQQWDTGEVETLTVAIRLALFDVYSRISPTTTLQGESESLGVGVVLLILLAVVGCLFLIILGVAFLMGLGLARSITGAVHELFVGTERVRRGDLSHKIAVHTRDQLGELASSFNSMTASIEDLLQEKAVKERLEQELRIARSIQMSLLPQSTLTLPGIGLTAHCEPAREVGGDYYDFLPIDDGRLGILVADVSGKGTSAALYMAELKGIVLSLSQRHTSPRELLIEANRIISRHLDSRSFITVSYLLVDLEARTLRYSRAGHCPMIYVPGRYAPSRTPQVLAPDGMVLGLTLDDGQMFARLLDEITLPLGAGDLFLLYTDGISEAMNAAGDCFGDARLAEVMFEHADQPSDALMARILDQVNDFAGAQAQQDDMTMVLMRVEQTGAAVMAVH